VRLQGRRAEGERLCLRTVRSRQQVVRILDSLQYVSLFYRAKLCVLINAHDLTDFKKTDWVAIIETIPTQLALVFFGLLHVPINLPSLAISIGEDNVDTDKELLSHGISNIASGLLGSVPNYLCESALLGATFQLFLLIASRCCQ